jgi:hypothetical protein
MTALEINANHFQMTYYLLILILSGYFIYKNIKDKEYALLYSFEPLAVAGIFALANATNLLATSIY